MYLYNSASHKKELFTPNNPEVVKMYTCGPTVYHFAHIGNLRTYIMEDVLEKSLRYMGYNVKRVMNITDVGHLASDADTGEDKMLKGAKRENKSVMEIAQYYTEAFFVDCDKLNIKKPDIVQPATGCIAEFIQMVTGLLDKGFAYVAGGNVYFDTSRLDKYYVIQQGLNHLDILVNAVGSRLNDIRLLDVQLFAISKECIGVILCDLHHSLILPLGALEHLVFAGIRIGGQMTHVRNIHNPLNIIA